MCEDRHLVPERGITKVKSEGMFYSITRESSVKSAQIRQN